MSSPKLFDSIYQAEQFVHHLRDSDSTEYTIIFHYTQSTQNRVNGLNNFKKHYLNKRFQILDEKVKEVNRNHHRSSLGGMGYSSEDSYDDIKYKVTLKFVNPLAKFVQEPEPIKELDSMVFIIKDIFLRKMKDYDQYEQVEIPVNLLESEKSFSIKNDHITTNMIMLSSALDIIKTEYPKISLIKPSKEEKGIDYYIVI